MTKDRNDKAKQENDRIRAMLRMQRYRARQRGEDVPLRRPGPRPKPPMPTIPASPGVDRSYALDFHSPVRHVATELDKAGMRGATVVEMAKTYRHSITGDLSRIRHWHGLDTDYEAVRFLIDRAVSALGVRDTSPGQEDRRPDGQVRPARRNSAYRLAVPFDDLRWEGKQLTRSRRE